MNKVFSASYFKTYSRGAYDAYECIIVAQNEAEAVMFLAKRYFDTVPAKWIIEEVNLNEPGVTEISRDSN